MTARGSDALLDLARSRIDWLQGTVSATGLQCYRPPDSPFGVGFGVAWSETHYGLVSIMGGGSGTENAVNITAGVLRDVQQGSVAVLERCNKRTRDNAWLPCFLHEAEAGWDVLIQQRHLFDVLTLTPPNQIRRYIEGVAAAAEETRGEMETDEQVGGQSYRWNPEDLSRLLIRSML